MDLMQAIHQRWAANIGLSSLLPTTRVFTGLSVGTDRPYAVVNERGGRLVERYNDGSAVEQVDVRIEVHDDRYDSTATIAEQIRAVFVRTAFDLAGGDRVVDVRCQSDSPSQDEDGIWRRTIELQFLVHVKAGV